MPRYAWDVYRAAARSRWIDQVIASTADEAVRAAAVEFKTDGWKPIAVCAYEVA
jgi:hypothetical protein